MGLSVVAISNCSSCHSKGLPSYVVMTRDLLLCLYTLNGCYIVAGDIAFSSSLEGACIPPVTITVVDNLKVLTCRRVCVCVCVCDREGTETIICTPDNVT